MLDTNYRLIDYVVQKKINEMIAKNIRIFKLFTIAEHTSTFVWPTHLRTKWPVLCEQP